MGIKALLGVLALGAVLSLGACETPPQEQAQRLVVRSVTVIPMDRPGELPGQDVVIEGTRILAIGPSGSIPLRGPDRVIDGRGKFLIPGLWDMHVHASRPTDQIATRHALPLALSYGIVGVRDMGATLDDFKAMKAAAGSDPNLPELVAAGPLLDGPAPPSRRFVSPVALSLADAEAARQAVRDLAKEKVDFLKVYDRLTPAQFEAIADEAKKIGLPFAGHIPLSMNMEAVSAAGQSSIEHVTLELLQDCIPGGETARQSVLNAWISNGDEAKFREFSAWIGRRDVSQCRMLHLRLASRGTYITPTLTLDFVGQEWTTDEDLLELTPTAQSACKAFLSRLASASGDASQAAHSDMLAIVRDLHAAGVRLLAGTDASNTCVGHGRSLHKELQFFRQAGLTPQEVLEAATLNPARFLGRVDEGVVRAGAVANLLLLDANPLADIANTLRINGLVFRGDWRDGSYLKTMRAAAIAGMSGQDGAQAP